MDEDGYLWYQGRADDVIKSVGLPHRPGRDRELPGQAPGGGQRRGDRQARRDARRVVKAFIVLQPGHAPSTDARSTRSSTHVRGRLAPYEYPREIEFIDALPMTTTGKVQRKELREREEVEAERERRREATSSRRRRARAPCAAAPPCQEQPLRGAAHHAGLAARAADLFRHAARRHRRPLPARGGRRSTSPALARARLCRVPSRRDRALRRARAHGACCDDGAELAYDMRQLQRRLAHRRGAARRARYATAVKPFESLLERLQRRQRSGRIAVVGGGAGGAEIAMALRFHGAAVTLYSERAAARRRRSRRASSAQLRRRGRRLPPGHGGERDRARAAGRRRRGAPGVRPGAARHRRRRRCPG